MIKLKFKKFEDKTFVSYNKSIVRDKEYILSLKPSNWLFLSTLVIDTTLQKY